VALQLRNAGVKMVRPLEGGFEAWRALGYPIEKIVFDKAESVLGP